MTSGNQAERNGIPEHSGGRRYKLWWKISLAIFVLVVGIYFAFIRPATQTRVATQMSARQTRGIPVTAIAVKKGDMALYLTGLGTVTPLNTVTVKTRVDGQLMNIRYKEGQTVKAGDILATIDPRPFEVQLAQAEGQMARDQAVLKNAILDLERYRILWQQDSISKQQLDTQESLVRQYEGIVKADQGQIDSARLQLVYCRIVAPVSGRAGLRLVDSGNIVHASDSNGLVVITQLQPITVIFPLPEDSLTQVLKKLKSGVQLQVEAYDRALKNRLSVGTLLTIDNQVDPNTGTVKLRAIFENSAFELFPNQFVNAKLLIDARRGVVIVPSTAVQRGPQGTFVYVVNTNSVANVRPVVVGEMQGGEASINNGLSAEELVVTDGAERLRDGARVDLKDNNEKGPQKEP